MRASAPSGVAGSQAESHERVTLCRHSLDRHLSMRRTSIALLACLGLLAVHRSAPAQRPLPSVPKDTVTLLDSVLALGGDYFRAERRALPEYTAVEAAGDSVLSVVDQRGRPARSIQRTGGHRLAGCSPTPRRQSAAMQTRSSSRSIVCSASRHGSWWIRWSMLATISSTSPCRTS
jgi:hypothetical protein